MHLSEERETTIYHCRYSKDVHRNKCQDVQSAYINIRITTYVCTLKVVSAILGRNINDYIHLIFPHDPLAARLIKRISVGSLCSEITHNNKRSYQTLKTKINIYVFLTAGLRGGQLADREEISEECDHLCFGLESLIQPLSARTDNIQ